MKKIYYIALCMLSITALVACSNDDEPQADAIDTSKIKQVEDFTDSRDGHVYKCIQIGDQIWMAENLAYYIERGSLSGCYTWDEETFESEGGGVALTDEEWYNIAFPLATEMMEWGAWMLLGNNWTGSRLEMEMMYFPMASLLGLPAISDAYTTRLAELVEAAEIEKGEALIPSLALEHTETAEEENGHYSEEFGYLYTLDAARAAVPEGWRLPSDEDWMKLEAALGMEQSEIERNNAWRGINAGTYLKEGGASQFEAKLGGCNGYVPSTNSMNYINLDKGGYFWTSEETIIEDNGSVTTEDSTESSSENESSESTEEEEETSATREGVVRFVTIYSTKIWRGTTRLYNGYRETTYSVRCVKDAN